MTRSPLRGRVLLGLALCLAQAVGCSSADDDKAKSAADGPEKRDTTVVHEPCDGGSSDAQKVDVNGDGKPDIIHVMKAGKEACRIVDLNMDGSVDAFIYYDDQGRERRRESDFDRDGRADEIAVFEGGVLKLKLRETNFDNKIDTWDHYDGGRLVRRERDSDGDGIVDQWWNFNDPAKPKCAVVASDRNADGKPDPESVVDLCGESYGVPKSYAPPPSTAPSSSAASATPGSSAAAPPRPEPTAAPAVPPKQPAKK